MIPPSHRRRSGRRFGCGAVQLRSERHAAKGLVETGCCLSGSRGCLSGAVAAAANSVAAPPRHERRSAAAAASHGARARRRLSNGSARHAGRASPASTASGSTLACGRRANRPGWRGRSAAWRRPRRPSTPSRPRRSASSSRVAFVAQCRHPWRRSGSTSLSAAQSWATSRTPSARGSRSSTPSCSASSRADRTPPRRRSLSSRARSTSSMGWRRGFMQ